MSDRNGDKLAKAGVNLFCVYGGTECGVHTRVLDTEDSPGALRSFGKTRDDWAWFALNEDRVRPRYDPQGDGSYELQYLVRHPRVSPPGALS